MLSLGSPSASKACALRLNYSLAPFIFSMLQRSRKRYWVCLSIHLSGCKKATEHVCGAERQNLWNGWCLCPTPPLLIGCRNKGGKKPEPRWQLLKCPPNCQFQWKSLTVEDFCGQWKYTNVGANRDCHNSQSNLFHSSCRCCGQN